MFAGQFNKRRCREYSDTIKKALTDLTDNDAEEFRKAFIIRSRRTCVNCFGLDAGDDIYSKAGSTIFSGDVQAQLSLHHTGKQGSNKGEQKIKANNAESVLNLSSENEPWKKELAILKSNSGYKFFYSDPELLAFIISNDENLNLFTIDHLKSINKCVEGFLLFINLLTSGGLHNPSNGKNMLMLALNMCTYTGQDAKVEPISSSTRNGLNSIFPPNAALSKGCYENCVNVIERMLKSNEDNVIMDNLKATNSRHICGMPPLRGENSFDLVMKLEK